MKNRKKSYYQKISNFLDLLEKDPIIRFFFGSLVVVTFVHIIIDLNDRRDERLTRYEERLTRKEEQIARAWSLLTSRASGNSGKKEALEILFSNNVSLRGIDLSCSTMGGGWDEERLECARPVDLSGVNLASPEFSEYSLQSRNPQDTVGDKKNKLILWRDGCLAERTELSLDSFLFNNIGYVFGDSLIDDEQFDVERYRVRKEGADFRNANLSGVDFTGANLNGANFSYADMRGVNFDRVSGVALDLRNAAMQGMSVRSANLSGSQIWYEPGSCLGSNRIVEKIENFDAPVCSTDELVKNLSIMDTFLDGTEISFSRLAEIYISGSSAINSSISIGKLESGEIPGARGWLDTGRISGNDFSCSVFFHDDNLDLGLSNISRATFPPRISFPTPISDDWEPFLSRGFGSSSWKREGSLAWAWENEPPIGNLAAERIISCSPELKLDWSLGRIQYSHDECSFMWWDNRGLEAHTGNPHTKANLFQLADPISFAEAEKAIMRSVDEKNIRGKD